LGDWLERGRFGEPDTFYLQQMVNRDNFPQSREDWIVPGSLHNVELCRVEPITEWKSGWLGSLRKKTRIFWEDQVRKKYHCFKNSKMLRLVGLPDVG